MEWAKQAEDLGAGEILLTSIDREGTGDGFDIKLYSNCKKILNIPIVAHGGASKLEQVKEVFKIIKNSNHLNRLVTLSPLTEMARNFHLHNGAEEVQVNEETQNFEYKL